MLNCAITNKNLNHDGKLLGLGLPNVNLNGTFAKKPGEGIRQQPVWPERPNTDHTNITLITSKVKTLSSVHLPLIRQEPEGECSSNSASPGFSGKFVGTFMLKLTLASLMH